MNETSNTSGRKFGTYVLLFVGLLTFFLPTLNITIAGTSSQWSPYNMLSEALGISHALGEDVYDIGARLLYGDKSTIHHRATRAALSSGTPAAVIIATCGLTALAACYAILLLAVGLFAWLYTPKRASIIGVIGIIGSAVALICVFVFADAIRSRAAGIFVLEANAGAGAYALASSFLLILTAQKVKLDRYFE